MAAKTPEKQEKILRIGIIHGGKIVEERLLKKREAVTVGSDPKNSFVLPGADVPKGIKLFDLKGAVYALCFTDRMDGRLTVNESVIDFSGLKSQNLATKIGDTYRINLTDSSKGKVQIGDVTLLFQFVVPPPQAPKAVLPAVARGGLIKSADPFFSGLVTASIILHFGTAAWLNTLEPPPPPTLEDVGERFAKYIAPDLSKIKPPPKVEEAKAEGPSKQEKKGGDEGKKKKDDGGKKGPSAADKKAAIQKAVASKGLLKVLGAKGAGGAFADVFANSGPGQGLGQMLAGAGAGGVGVAGVNDGAMSGPRGAGGGGTADIGALGVSGGGGGGGAGAGIGSRGSVSVRGEVQSAGATEVDGSLDPKLITKTIRARMAGFKACYENALKRSPNLQGKVTVAFTIDTEGRVSEANVEADTLGDPEVSRCIVQTFRRIRFPKPDEGSVSASFPFVFVNAGG